MERRPYSDRDNRRSGAYSSSRSGSAVRSSASRPVNGRAPQGSRPNYSDNRRSNGPYSTSYGNPDANGCRPNGQRPYNNNQGRRNPPPPPRRRRKKINPVPLVILLCVLAVFIYIGSAWITVRANEGTYCKNISVNGIDLDKYSHEEGLQLVQNEINTLLTNTHTLSWQDRSWSFTAADFGAHIDVDALMERAWNIGHYGSMFSRRSAISDLKNNPVVFTAPMEYDDALIDSFVTEIYDAVYVAPVDAEVTITPERPYMSGESSTGLALNWEDTREKVVQLMETGAGSTSLLVEVVEPAISSSEAEGGLEKIVEFKTDMSFRGWHSRVNVRTALSNFNTMCVYPGETYSFNSVVGPRTEVRGYEKATEYAGNGTQQNWGGGVCQASTTLYNALLLAGMEIIERSPHSMTVTYVQPSLDAAVLDGGKDLIFRNDTDSAIYIYTSVTKEWATVTIYGNKPEYRYELMSKIVRQDDECQYVDYIDDTEGKYVYYSTDTPVLYSTGHPALDSEGWLVAFDWETGDEMWREQLSFDKYESGTNIYWRGVHDIEEAAVPVDPVPAAEPAAEGTAKNAETMDMSQLF